MTAQVSDSIFYKGEWYGMASQPLYPYLKQSNKNYFVWQHTACYRGYVAKWVIENNELFLTQLNGTIRNFEEVNLDFLFPNEDKVFASWFTGEIRIPSGELLEYVHHGYGSMFEKDIFLEFSEGKLISEKEVDNHDAFMKLIVKREEEKKMESFWYRLFHRRK